MKIILLMIGAFFGVMTVGGVAAFPLAYVATAQTILPWWQMVIMTIFLLILGVRSAIGGSFEPIIVFFCFLFGSEMALGFYMRSEPSTDLAFVGQVFAVTTSVLPLLIGLILNLKVIRKRKFA